MEEKSKSVKNSTKIVIMMAMSIALVLFGMMAVITPINTSKGMAKGIKAEDDVLKKALIKTGAKYSQTQYNGWVRINRQFRNDKEAEQYFKECLNILAYKKEPSINIDSINYYTNTISAKAEVMSGEIARLTLIYSPGQHQGEMGNAFVLSLASRKPLPINLENVLKKVAPGENVSSSIVCIGKVNEIIARKVIKNNTNRILTWMKSKNLDEVENDKLVSVTGYTPMLSRRLTVGRKSVNINMAFRYNFVEKSTLVYIGTPIITSEY